MIFRSMAIVLCVCQASAGGGQKGGQDREEDFWLQPNLQKPAAVAQLVAGYQPVSLWPIYRYQRWWVWLLPEEDALPFDGKFAPPLDPKLLATLPELDKKTVPDLRLRKGSRAEVNFILLYRDAIIKAGRVPQAAFAERAKDYTHLTWAHLYGEPELHYGKVVSISGKLHRVRKYDAPSWARQKDIPFIYEGWLDGPTAGANPFAVEFTHLPAAIKVAEKLEPPPSVTFHGYFLGRYRYRGGEGKDFVTHLLVGPTVVPAPPPPSAERESTASPLAYLVLYGILGVIGVVTVIMVGLNLWFRRGDQQVRDRLARIQAQRAIEALEEGSPPPEANEGDNGMRKESRS
jgi:hypothetical protein